MMKRREFLHATIAAIPLATVVLPNAGFVTEVGRLPFYKLIFDERFSDGVTFAAEVRRLGLPVQPIRGDVTDTWYNDLYYRWRDFPVAIAGLTTSRSLFCLDMFARDAGLRIVHYADHRTLSDGSIEHEVFGITGAQRTAMLKSVGAHWSAELANLIVRFPEQRLRAIRKTADVLTPAEDVQHLVSWVIASVHRMVEQFPDHSLSGG